MRALFSCWPGHGHFMPLVPLARAWSAAGHDSAFASAPRFCQRVAEPAGFLAFPAGLSPIEAQDRMGGGGGGEGGGAGPSDEAGEWRFGARMFAGATAAKAQDLAEVMRSWLPDVVVYDVLDMGAPLAAAAAGVPRAAHGLGPLPPAVFWDDARRLVGPAWRDRGGDPEAGGGPFGQVFLDICPPSLRGGAGAQPERAQPLRPGGGDPAAAESMLPPWARRAPGRRRVYVTLGTVFNRTPGLIEGLIAALGGEALDVVVTVGPDRDPDELGPLPPNVHVERWLDHGLILPSCDAVVCHGGSGTILAALAHGLPVLAIPLGANQRYNARRLAEVGAGAVLDAGGVGGAGAAGVPAVRAGLAGLLDDPSYGRRARAVQQEIASMPGPEVAVGLLQDLARGKAVSSGGMP